MSVLGALAGAGVPFSGGAVNPLSGLGGLFGGNSGLGALASAYGSAYNQALQSNMKNYTNILGLYQGMAQQQQQGSSVVQAGYQGLGNQVQGILGANYGVPGTNNQWGIAAPAALALQQGLTSQTGQQFDANGVPLPSKGTGGSIGANLENTGLYNTSENQDAVQAANTGFGTNIGQLAANLGQTYAGYASNIGLAGLNYAGQSLNTLLGIGQNAANWMNSIYSPYPSAAPYAQLAQGQGAYLAAQQARGLNNPYGGFGTAGVARSGGNMSTMGGMDTSGYGAPGGIQPYGLQGSAYASNVQQPGAVAQQTSYGGGYGSPYFGGSQTLGTDWSGGTMGPQYAAPTMGGNASVGAGFGGGAGGFGNVISSPTGYAINSPTDQSVYGAGLTDIYGSYGSAYV